MSNSRAKASLTGVRHFNPCRPGPPELLARRFACCRGDAAVGVEMDILGGTVGAEHADPDLAVSSDREAPSSPRDNAISRPGTSPVTRLLCSPRPRTPPRAARPSLFIPPNPTARRPIGPLRPPEPPRSAPDLASQPGGAAPVTAVPFGSVSSPAPPGTPTADSTRKNVSAQDRGYPFSAAIFNSSA